MSEQAVSNLLRGGLLDFFRRRVRAQDLGFDRFGFQSLDGGYDFLILEVAFELKEEKVFPRGLDVGAAMEPGEVDAGLGQGLEAFV